MESIASETITECSLKINVKNHANKSTQQHLTLQITLPILSAFRSTIKIVSSMTGMGGSLGMANLP